MCEEKFYAMVLYFFFEIQVKCMHILNEIYIYKFMTAMPFSIIYQKWKISRGNYYKNTSKQFLFRLPV